MIGQEKKVPEQWKQGLICRIPKKVNLQQCGNWRGVTLLPIASKVLGKILISRIQGGEDHRQDLDQEEAQSSRSSSYATSWGKSTSGMLPCTFISLTLRRRLTRCTETACGGS